MSHTYKDKLNQQPFFAPRSLIIRFVDSVSYDQGKQFLENLGLTVRHKGFLWDNRHAIFANTPDDNIDQWMAKIYAQSGGQIRYVEKERLSHLATR